MTFIRPARSYVLDGGAVVAEKVEPYYRTAKVVYRVIDFIDALTSKVAKPLLQLSAELRGTTDFIECTRFFGVANEVFTPKKGVYFLTNPKNSWQKIVDKVTLALHSALKMVGAALKYGFITLGRIATFSIGQLPVFKLVTDGFYAISSFFGAWEARNRIRQLNSSVKHADKQITAWENFEQQNVLIHLGEETELRTLKTKFEAVIKKRTAMIEEKQKQLPKLEEARIKALAKANGNADASKPKAKAKAIAALKGEIAKCEARIALCKGYLEKISAKDYSGLAEAIKLDLVKNPEALQKEGAVQKAIDAKIRKWEVIKAEVRSSRMKIISSACKVAVISCALTFTALNTWTFPFLITVVSLGLLGDGCSFVRVFHDRYRLPKAS